MKDIEYIWLANKSGVMHVRLGGGYERPLCGANGKIAEHTNTFCFTCVRGLRVYGHRLKCVTASWKKSF